ncbi:U2 small nuclear ribonucleoprotein auxiliary factor 35 kDa subunit-related protein 2 [Girardinichthys multiradiatus]|uniref:U2 small nuclear ribonucleoprotein auxiliary factor 35 kDa subunit-related protein 2 n=1 Tax=Girardinichthys multiradiatus TaxID=208333 RepID=UPI001FAB4958|nr:U2 small nuclear ribonucleoprotein auxiliary factor 35 kDa subunit-related protein 2 [Girardinichthys multiradiatus]
MAAAIIPLVSTPALSQKQRRAAQRKERRRRKRQALAQTRECELTNEAEEEEELNEGDGEEDNPAEDERQRQHEEWLEKERLAQEEFRQRTEREEVARKKKEEEEHMIKEEWEAQQRREQEEKEQRQQEKRNREEAVQKRLDEAENQLDNGGPWMNPEAPVTVNLENFGTERDVANCPFFLKTGACRFGDRCSRKHMYPTSSPTLLVRGMFKTFGMEEWRRDDYDMDACLEHSEEELLESFLEFYHDVLPEFKGIGKVVQFKVCCNHEPHLRGNVYVQFETEELCKEAFMKFNGRWYAGRQLQCETCPVTRWKNAICGLFDRQKCPKGKHCNFLHVFRNPGNEFWEADRDLQISPDRSVRGSRREEWHSERYRERSWRQRRSSRSPARSERSHRRWEDDMERSRSRERRTSHQRRDDQWSSRSRHSDRRTDRHRSRSRDRSRSRSRDREQRRDKEMEKKYRDRNEDEGPRRETREKSRSTSREKKRHKQSRERSPKISDKSLSDGTKTHRHHRRSKKSKKSKKKHKKKRLLSEKTCSSTQSETESEEETWDNPSILSPSGDLKEEEKTREKCADENNLDSEVKTEATPEIKSDLTSNGDIRS